MVMVISIWIYMVINPSLKDAATVGRKNYDEFEELWKPLLNRREVYSSSVVYIEEFLIR